MLNIKTYEDENKKLSGYNSCCAYVDTDDCDGYTNLDQIETRCATYKEARNELINHLKVLRDEIDDLLQKEDSNYIEVITNRYNYRYESCPLCKSELKIKKSSLSYKYNKGYEFATVKCSCCNKEFTVER